MDWKDYIKELSYKYGVQMMDMSFKKAESYVTKAEWKKLTEMMKYSHGKLKRVVH